MMPGYDCVHFSGMDQGRDITPEALLLMQINFDSSKDK